MSHTKKRQSIEVSVSAISGSTFPLFLRAFRGSKVHPKYYFRVFIAGLVSLFGEPFRLWERLRHGKRIDNLSIEEPPVFILGHWRSGTTFLHNLMSQDPNMGYVDTYQGIFPNQTLGGKWFFKNLMKANMPEKRVHDNVALSPDYPQEEEFAIGGTNPYGYYRFWFFPERTKEYYRNSIHFEGLSDKDKNRWKTNYIRLVKKALLNTKGKRFLSKNPPHTGRVETLLEMFPNAKFIYIYRNPVTVFLSTEAFMRKQIKPLNFHDIDDRKFEDNIFYVYEELIRKFEQDKRLIPEGNLVEIKYEEFVKDPLEGVGQIYDSLNLNGFVDARGHFKGYIESQRAHKKNIYRLNREKLDEIIERCKYGMELWDYSLPDNIEVINNNT